MAGKTLSLARVDSKKYVTAGGFEEDITLITPDGNTTLETTGFVSKHWINFDTDGAAVNSKNAHITIDEDKLSSANYPVRNSINEVSLLGHRINTKDSTNTVRNYIVIEQFPDETLGLIACILGDFQTV